MKSLVIIAIALLLMAGGVYVYHVHDSALGLKLLMGSGAVVFVIGCLVNHGEHLRRK